MSIVAIIPARGGSKGIPNKNIIDFYGKPLIAWSIEAAAESNKVDAVYVSTDDENIAEISIHYGAKIIERPDDLAQDNSIADMAIIHAIEYLEEKNTHIDTVVFLQATSPIRTASNLDEAIDIFNKKQADSLFSACKLEDYCIWSLVGDQKESITYDYRNRGNRQDRQPYYLENGSFYIFKPGLIKEKRNRLGGKIEMYVMPFWMSYEIDSPDDLDVCKFFMQKLLNITDKHNR